MYMTNFITLSLLKSRRLITTLAVALVPMIGHAEYQLIDRVVAIVEDDVVLASEVRQDMFQITQVFKSRGQRLPPADELYEQMLERNILEKLQLQRAARIGMRIPDQELNRQMQDIARGNGVASIAQFSELLAREGRSYREVREEIRRDMLIQQVQRGSVIRNIVITPAEIESFLSSEEGKQAVTPEFDIDHVMLSLSSDASDNAKARAQTQMHELKQQAKEEGGFTQQIIDKFGVEHSPLGWRKAEDVPSLFDPAYKALSTNDISHVIDNGDSLHLIQLKQKRGDLAKFITETKVKHILISPSEIRDQETSSELADDIHQRLLDGGNFLVLARQYSDDPGSALSGGDLGWAQPGQMVPEFEVMMDRMEIDEISPVFESQFGYHILVVEERREKDLTRERQERIARNTIGESKYQDALSAWLQELRDEAYVEIK